MLPLRKEEAVRVHAAEMAILDEAVAARLREQGQPAPPSVSMMRDGGASSGGEMSFAATTGGSPSSVGAGGGPASGSSGGASGGGGQSSKDSAMYCLISVGAGEIIRERSFERDHSREILWGRASLVARAKRSRSTVRVPRRQRERRVQFD